MSIRLITWCGLVKGLVSQQHAENPPSSTLHPQLSTLTSQPSLSTLNSQPSTLNPQLSTLNSHPSTLNPQHTPEGAVERAVAACPSVHWRSLQHSGIMPRGFTTHLLQGYLTPMCVGEAFRIETLWLMVSPRTRYVERGGWVLSKCRRISPCEASQVMSLNVLIKNILDLRSGNT